MHGQPSFTNMLDALNAWQLVREASQRLGRPVAASFKHVSPAGVAVPGPVDEVAAGLFGAGGGRLTDLTRAYLRARDADPKSSYGDFAAVSHPVDNGVRYIAEPGGSNRSAEIEAACREHQITLVCTGVRLFHH